MLPKLVTIKLAILLTISASAAPINTYKIVAKYPHSTDSYTEGLFYLNGLFYESRVPHLRDSFIVAKVGIVQSTTALLNQPQNLGCPILRSLIAKGGTYTLSPGRVSNPRSIYP